ncbi:hypothetical protein HDU76_002930 [Blyttiomyces sp. JEL0837]|nr:hypothetical protein HDU76_002930 [Blyttiomyces sp. JEL0837]
MRQHHHQHHTAPQTRKREHVDEDEFEDDEQESMEGILDSVEGFSRDHFFRQYETDSSHPASSSSAYPSSTLPTAHPVSDPHGFYQFNDSQHRDPVNRFAVNALMQDTTRTPSKPTTETQHPYTRQFNRQYQQHDDNQDKRTPHDNNNMNSNNGSSSKNTSHQHSQSKPTSFLSRLFKIVVGPKGSGASNSSTSNSTTTGVTGPPPLRRTRTNGSIIIHHDDSEDDSSSSNLAYIPNYSLSGPVGGVGMSRPSMGSRNSSTGPVSPATTTPRDLMASATAIEMRRSMSGRGGCRICGGSHPGHARCQFSTSGTAIAGDGVQSFALPAVTEEAITNMPTSTTTPMTRTLSSGLPGTSSSSTIVFPPRTSSRDLRIRPRPSHDTVASAPRPSLTSSDLSAGSVNRRFDVGMESMQSFFSKIKKDTQRAKLERENSTIMGPGEGYSYTPEEATLMQRTFSADERMVLRTGRAFGVDLASSGASASNPVTIGEYQVQGVNMDRRKSSSRRRQEDDKKKQQKKGTSKFSLFPRPLDGRRSQPSQQQPKQEGQPSKPKQSIWSQFWNRAKTSMQHSHTPNTDRYSHKQQRQQSRDAYHSHGQVQSRPVLEDHGQNSNSSRGGVDMMKPVTSVVGSFRPLPDTPVSTIQSSRTSTATTPQVFQAIELAPFGQSSSQRNASIHASHAEFQTQYYQPGVEVSTMPLPLPVSPPTKIDEFPSPPSSASSFVNLSTASTAVLDSVIFPPLTPIRSQPSARSSSSQQPSSARTPRASSPSLVSSVTLSAASSPSSTSNRYMTTTVEPVVSGRASRADSGYVKSYLERKASESNLSARSGRSGASGVVFGDGTGVGTTGGSPVMLASSLYGGSLSRSGSPDSFVRGVGGRSGLRSEEGLANSMNMRRVGGGSNSNGSLKKKEELQNSISSVVPVVVPVPVAPVPVNITAPVVRGSVAAAANTTGSGGFGDLDSEELSLEDLVGRIRQFW